MTADGRRGGQWEERSGGVGERRFVGDRYELRERLAAGGMGAVWRAYDMVMRRDVALKEMHVPYGLGRLRDPDARAFAVERMRREARAAGRVDHPSVVTIHDVIVHEEHPWIVMELVRGETLADRLDREVRLAEPEAARITIAVLEGLSAAHERGVLHRDVKPANVLLGAGGRVVLTDFGIARIEGETSLTVTGQFVGSLSYCAPERMGGRQPGPESDLWSLGVVLYEAVEGVSPFDRRTMEATVAAVLSGAPGELPHAPRLAPLVRRLLAMEPGERPSAEEARAALRAVAVAAAEGTDTRAEPAGEAAEQESQAGGAVGELAAAARPPERTPTGRTPTGRTPTEAPPSPSPSGPPPPSSSGPPPPPPSSGEGGDTEARAEGSATARPRLLAPFRRARAGLRMPSRASKPPLSPQPSQPSQPSPPSLSRRSRLVLVCGVCAAAAGIGGAGWLIAHSSGGAPGTQPGSPKSPAAPGSWTRNLRTYDEGGLGYRIAVPAGFRRRSGADRVTYTDAHDPQVWIEVYRDTDPPPGAAQARDWARREVEWLAQGRPSDGEEGERRTVSTDVGTFASTRHRGERAAEYTVRLRSVDKDGERSRQVVQRNLVVRDGSGGMYQLRVSVPESEDGEVGGRGLFEAASSRFT